MSQKSQKCSRPYKYSPHAVSASFSTYVHTASPFYEGQKTRENSPRDNKEGDDQPHHKEEGEEGDGRHDGHQLSRLLQGGQVAAGVGHQP